MKKLYLPFLIVVFFSLFITQIFANSYHLTICDAELIEKSPRAPDSEYLERMQETIFTLMTAATYDELRPLVNQFLEIAEKYPEEWLPPYYSSLAFAFSGYLSQGSIGEKDALFDEADKHLAIAEQLDPEISEIMALKSFILMGRLSADLQARSMYMGETLMWSLDQARQFDAENPRIRLLSALMEHGSAQFMGQSTDQACNQALSVKPAIEAELRAAEEGSILPSWGMNLIQFMQAQCP